MQYLDAVLARGFTVDEVAPYFSFITGVDMDFFEAVGKLRAYRKIWAQAHEASATAPRSARSRSKLKLDGQRREQCR